MYFLGTLTISLAAAAIFVLAFEFPFTRVEKLLVSIDNYCVIHTLGFSLQVGKLIGALMGDPKTGGGQTPHELTGKQSLPALNVTKKEEDEEETVKNEETSETEDSGKGSQKSHSSTE